MIAEHRTTEFLINAEIDDDIYELVTLLWQAKHNTEWSCQDNLGRTYILFYGDIYAKSFYRLLSDNKIPCKLDLRETVFGGGGSVEFNPKYINTVTELVRDNVKSIGSPLRLNKINKEIDFLLSNNSATFR